MGEEVGFLHGVLGLGVVLEDAARGAVELLVVASHQPDEGGTIPSHDPGDRLALGELVRRRQDRSGRSLCMRFFGWDAGFSPHWMKLRRRCVPATRAPDFLRPPEVVIGALGIID